MRRVVVVLLCLIPPIAVQAQRRAGAFSVGGFGGVGLPVGPEVFTYFWKTGYGLGGEFKFDITEMTSLAASFTYQLFRFDGEAMTEFLEEQAGEPLLPGVDVGYSGGALTMAIISVNLIQHLSPPGAPVGFYLSAGGGYYMPKVKNLSQEQAFQNVSVKVDVWAEDDWDLDDGFGLDGGVGLELTLGGGSFCLFAEGKYYYTFIQPRVKDGDIEEEYGKKTGNISFITIMGGLRFTP